MLALHRSRPDPGCRPVPAPVPTSYYHHDGLGSVAGITGGAGNARWTYSFQPFGLTRTEQQGAGTQPANFMKYTDEYLDSTGLYHLRARQYDPTWSRFMRPDPVDSERNAPYVAAYVYAGNRPTIMVDPSSETFRPSGESRVRTLVASSPALPLGNRAFAPLMRRTASSAPRPPYRFGSCRSFGRYEEEGLFIAIQQNPRGTLQWGTGFYDPYVVFYFGAIWTVTATLHRPGKQPVVDVKGGLVYNPHGSFKAELLTLGTTFGLRVFVKYEDPTQIITWRGRADCQAG